MHRVKATLLKLQPNDGIANQVHTAINVDFRGVGMVSTLYRRTLQVRTQSASPEQPQMNGGKGRKENPQMHRIFAYLKTWDCLNRASGTSKALHGNGVTIVPNVQAVMAWAARKVLATKGDISKRGATKISGSGGRVIALLPKSGIRG